MAKTYTIGLPDATATLTIMDSHSPPRPAPVDGVPIWASSDETVVRVTAADDGMSATITPVAPTPTDVNGAPIPARITVTADADLGAGVVPITGVSEDILVQLDPNSAASVVAIALGDQPTA